MKPNGHIKVSLDRRWFSLLPVGLFFTVFDAVAVILLGTSKNGSDTKAIPVFALMLLVGLVMIGYTVYRIWQSFQQSRILEETGQLYLGQFKTVHQGTELYGGQRNKTASHRLNYYQFGFIFTTSDGQTIESTYRVYGEHPDIQSALPLRPGTPVAVLYSPANGIRLL